MMNCDFGLESTISKIFIDNKRPKNEIWPRFSLSQDTRKSGQIFSLYHVFGKKEIKKDNVPGHFSLRTTFYIFSVLFISGWKKKKIRVRITIPPKQ